MPGIPVFLVSEKLVFRQILAEKEGFEPSCRLPDKRISSAPRYDLFDTSPYPLVCRAQNAACVERFSIIEGVFGISQEKSFGCLLIYGCKYAS